MPSLFRRPVEVDPAVVAVERGDQITALQQLLAQIRSDCSAIIGQASVRDSAAGQLQLLLATGSLSRFAEDEALGGGQ